MGKKGQNEVWIMWILKSLLAAYVVTGILLMILAMALYKFELTEEAVTAGITAVYLLSTFAGGLVAGHTTSRTQRKCHQNLCSTSVKCTIDSPCNQ